MTHPFDRDYFHGGAKVGGYAREGYWDYPIHHLTARKIMALKPESVLELGAARGYILKRLEDDGVRVKGLEISEHCRLTRVIDDIVTWDITQTPWPIADQSFDLCFSIAVLEHIPEDKLPAVFAEMARTCKRGYHGIDLHDDDHFDKTHVSIHDAAWWKERLPAGHEGVDKEDLEKGAIDPPSGTGVKLNIGSFTTMFHHGWRNIDTIDLSRWAQQFDYTFMHWDVLKGLPYDDNVVDLIFSCHVLEHFSYDDGAKLLAECARVLKPGGVLRVLVPDTHALIEQYNANRLNLFDELSSTAAARSTQAGKLWELLCGGDHRSFYDWTTLEHVLQSAGFGTVERATFRKSRSTMMQRETMDLFPDISLIAEAVVSG